MPAMMVVGDVILRRESPLGKRAIPLRRRCRDCLGEIQRGHDLAALPATVRWRVSSSEEVGFADLLEDSGRTPVRGTESRTRARSEREGHVLALIEAETLRGVQCEHLGFNARMLARTQ